mmetsp:Transcript_55928/g.159194  ORF Transcript_55928/g.159194 Transcript_55928/m.159194 type:complete len:334 (-) Transcript_55928:9-1010(-)
MPSSWTACSMQAAITTWEHSIWPAGLRLAETRNSTGSTRSCTTATSSCSQVWRAGSGPARSSRADGAGGETGRGSRTRRPESQRGRPKSQSGRTSRGRRWRRTVRRRTVRRRGARRPTSTCSSTVRATTPATAAAQPPRRPRRHPRQRRRQRQRREPRRRRVQPGARAGGHDEPPLARGVVLRRGAGVAQPRQLRPPAGQQRGPDAARPPAGARRGRAGRQTAPPSGLRQDELQPRQRLLRQRARQHLLRLGGDMLSGHRRAHLLCAQRHLLQRAVLPPELDLLQRHLRAAQRALHRHGGAGPADRAAHHERDALMAASGAALAFVCSQHPPR